jgi:hypothetical protein
MKIEAGPISEDNCVVCGEWPEADRAYLRVYHQPANGGSGQVCDACLLAFWDNWLGRPDSDGPDEYFFPDIYATPPLPLCVGGAPLASIDHNIEPDTMRLC